MIAKFKIGDKVVPISKDRYKPYAYPLEVTEVKKVNGGGFMYHLYNTNCCWAGLYFESELMLANYKN